MSFQDRIQEIINSLDLNKTSYPTDYIEEKIYYLIAEGKIDIVLELLNRSNINVNYQKDKYSHDAYPDSIWGESFLHLCCKKNNFQVLEKILAHPKVNVNIYAERFRTPLYDACAKNSIECVKLLLTSQDLKINYGGMNHNTPLNIAIELEHEEIVKLLVGDKRININQCDVNHEPGIISAYYRKK